MNFMNENTKSNFVGLFDTLVIDFSLPLTQRMKHIQKQSIKSFLVIGIGFILGAVNFLILFPRILSKEEIGLTRLIMDIGLVLGTLATLGVIPVIYKFFPFYRHHLSKKENDLPFLSLLVTGIGCLLITVIAICFKAPIVAMFAKNSPIFIPYYYTIIPFAVCYTFFTVFEAYAWGTGKMVMSNFLKETFTRLITTIMVVVLLTGLINFDFFVVFFSLLYLLPAVILALTVKRSNQLPMNFKLSKVSRRLGSKMVMFSSFIFFSTVLNIVARTIDSVLIASLKDIGDMAIFAIASYFTNLLDIPQRSITSVTIPILAEHWRNKRIDKIEGIYKKSAIELLIIGVFISGCILLNINNIIRFLPQGKGYEAIFMPVVILLASKVVDLGTGINNQVIGTSNFWRFDFTTNVIYTICAVPLNYFLIREWGVSGAAMANLIAIIIYNSIRFVFIKRKFGMQPFTVKSVWIILIGLFAGFIAYSIPYLGNLYLDGLVRTPVFFFIFLVLILTFKISEDILGLVNKGLKTIGINKQIQ
jgi:O-antigen/teichoic acid export membrane protein